jgi:hypothetical protein
VDAEGREQAGEELPQQRLGEALAGKGVIPLTT